MRVIMRITTWAIEMLVQAVLLTIFIISISHVDSHVSPKDVLFLVVSVLIYFGLSGYTVTTLVARILLSDNRVWIYSIVAPMLFLIHFEFVNRMVAEGFMDPHNRVLMRVIGSFLVLVVTIAGSFALKKTTALIPAKTLAQTDDPNLPIH
jgi:hypothetical protein